MTAGVQLGLQLKQTGMTRAARKRNADLELARNFLVRLAMQRPGREVSADDVSGFELGNAAGSLFAEKLIWKWSGKFVPSAIPSNRCRYIRTWILL